MLTEYVVNARALRLETPGRAPADRAVEAVQPHRKGLLLKLEGIDTRDAAQAMVGGHLSLPEEALPSLADDEFYYSEIRGFRVHTTSGMDLGTIRETFHNGSTDIWVVRNEAREYLIPVIADVVRTIDRSGRAVTIEPMDGLLDL